MTKTSWKTKGSFYLKACSLTSREVKARNSRRETRASNWSRSHGEILLTGLLPTVYYYGTQGHQSRGDTAALPCRKLYVYFPALHKLGMLKHALHPTASLKAKLKKKKKKKTRRNKPLQLELELYCEESGMSVCIFPPPNTGLGEGSLGKGPGVHAWGSELWNAQLHFVHEW